MSAQAQIPLQPRPADVLLEVRELSVQFAVTRGAIFRRTVGGIKAVDKVSFAIRSGEVLGLVGESGCGKTTVARSILKLQRPAGGQILFSGTDIWMLDKAGDKRFRRRVQAIFQDPYSSLNPRMRVAEIVGEPLIIHGVSGARPDRERRVHELLDLCGLPRRIADCYPHEMSGGQRQRVGIARALALDPSLLICDEAVSALDVSIQAQIINLLEQLKEELGLTYLFIGHDLSVIKHICDRVCVMYLGCFVEESGSDRLFATPLHPYTRALLDAIPVPDPAQAVRPHLVISGEMPSPLDPPSGCVFHPRCPLAVGSCREAVPAWREMRPGHFAACSQIDSHVPPHRSPAHRRDDRVSISP